MSAFRRVGYRLLGPRFDYLLHTRPAEWPIMAAHTAVGYILAVGLDGIVRGDHLGAAARGLAAWVIGLNGGTLALNSAFDRDEGDVAYLRAPPAPPRYLAAFGVGLMAAGLAIASTLPPTYLVAYALCVALSVAYSVPPLRLKAVPGADWLINMWGFGAITPFALWTVTGRPVDIAHGLVLGAFCPLFAALYPLTQLYQLEEDTRRGDRTLARLLGIRGSLVAAVGAALVAFGCFAVAAAKSGWSVATDDNWRVAVLAAAGIAWLLVLVPWLVRGPSFQSREHQRSMYLALGAWAVTDIAVIMAWAWRTGT